jgi:hypothetical protein
VGSCTPFSSSFTIPNDAIEVDSRDGLLIYTDATPQNCSSTVIYAHILSYSKTNGVFANSPSNAPSESIGPCSYAVYNPDYYNESADLAENLFFGASYVSGSNPVITPYPFTTAGIFGLSEASVSLTNNNQGSLVLDLVNHLIFSLTGTNSSGVTTITGLSSNPYTITGFGSSGIPSSLSFSNNTYSCTQGSNCTFGIVSILN